MNVVNYDIKVRDFATSTIVKFANSIHQTTVTVNALKYQFQDFAQKSTLYTDRLTGHNKILSMSYKELQISIKRVENVAATSKVPLTIAAARKELESLSRQSNKIKGADKSAPSKKGGSSGGGLKNMLGGVKKILGAVGVSLDVGDIVSAGFNLISDSISKSFERQKIQSSFNILAGSKNSGEKLTADLVKLQKNSVLGPEVFQNAQNMLGHGIKAEDIAPNMKMLGDVSMGDTQKLNSLTQAFSQLYTAGKLTSDGLSEFINAGFDPLEVMAERTGKSISQLTRDVDEGKISFEDIKQSFIDATSEGGRFADAMEQIAETPAGKVQQLENAWDELKTKAGDSFMPLITNALEFANLILPFIESGISPLEDGIKKVSEWMSGLKDDTGGFKDYIDIVAQFFNESIVPLSNKLFGTISNIVIKLANFIKNSEFLKDIFALVYKFYGFIAKGIEGLLSALQWLFDKIFMPVINKLEEAYRFVKKLIFGEDSVKVNSKFSLDFNSKPKLPKSEEVNKKEKEDKKENKEFTNSIKNLVNHTTSNSNRSIKAKEDIISNKQQVVNIHVGKFLDSINLNSVNIQEGTADIEKIFMEMFARVLVGTTNDALS